MEKQLTGKPKLPKRVASIPHQTQKPVINASLSMASDNWEVKYGQCGTFGRWDKPIGGRTS